MKLKIYAIHDIKADLFGPPFFMSTAAEALRAFADLADDSNTTIGKHPGDYRLMQIGEFDNQKGAIEGSEPYNLGFASDYKAAGNITPLSVKAS
ncbi:MAG: nonstructural protein [Microvirus sp.]|nr:MAG: nonstructural protein [Microvirus sp.]